jgi:hypothetical protein
LQYVFDDILRCLQISLTVKSLQAIRFKISLLLRVNGFKEKFKINVQGCDLFQVLGLYLQWCILPRPLGLFQVKFLGMVQGVNCSSSVLFCVQAVGGPSAAKFYIIHSKGKA